MSTQPDVTDWPAYARDLMAKLSSTYEAAYASGASREDEIRLATHFHEAQARFERQGPALLKRALDDLDKAQATIGRVAEVYRTTAVSEDEATACELQERLGDALGEAVKP